MQVISELTEDLIKETRQTKYKESTFQKKRFYPKYRKQERKSISTVSLRCAIIWFHSHEARTGLHWMNILIIARRMTFPGSCTDL